MSELSHDAEALIEQGRLSTEPSERDKTRVRARLVHELGVAAFASTTIAGSAVAGSTVAGSTVAGSTAGSSVGVGTAKLAKGVSAWSMQGLVALSTLAGGALAIYAVQPQQSATNSPPTAAAPVHTAPEPQREMPAPQPTVRKIEPTRDTPLPAARATDSLRGARKHAKEARTQPSPNEAAQAVPGQVAPAQGAPPGLSEELALLARAQRELRTGHASEALATARRHAAAFPSGALAEERDGIETLARCMLGEHPDASARAFLARAPSSPLAARVRKECGVK